MINITTPKNTKNPHFLRYELKQNLKSIISKPITNKNDGRIATISAKSIGKLNSTKVAEKSIKNGFSEAQHFEATKHIKELYEKSTLKTE